MNPTTTEQIRDYIEFWLNGIRHQVKGAAAFATLSDYLRYECQLTGTKVVCAEGDCGACTVMSARWNPLLQKNSSYISLNSCIAMLFLLDGAHLVTVEGLAEDGKLCEVQSSMVRNFGGQCGFCTPGFVMSLTDLFENKSEVTKKQVQNSLTGNLCRCTGYLPILQAALDVNTKKVKPLASRYPLTSDAALMTKALHLRFEDKEIFAPTDLESACDYKLKNPEVVIFSGATDLGVQFNKGKLRPRKFMSLHLISELFTCAKTQNEFIIGAKTTLAEFQKLVQKDIPAVDEFLNIFASPQIKNAGTLIGNVANGSPIADTTPVLMALDTEVDVFGPQGKRSLLLKDLYLGYRKLNLQPGEIITHLRFQKPSAGAIFKNFKISQRRDLDISCVNASFLFETKNNLITKARIVYGGVGPVTQRLLQVEQLAIGQPLDAQLISRLKNPIRAEIHPISDARGTAQFRHLLAENLLTKFLQENAQP